MPTAIIFGHSSGLGLAMTRELLSDGYRVVGVSRHHAPLASHRLHELSVDLAKRDDVVHVTEEIRKAYTAFDVLIYSAGTLSAHELRSIDYDTLEHVYNVNVFAPVFIESHLFDLIKSNSADVINITSSSIVDHYPLFAEYATSKAALAMFTTHLRRELQNTSARVIEVCPSGFASSIYDHMLGERIERDESKQIAVTDMAGFIITLLKLPKRMEVGRVYIGRK